MAAQINALPGRAGNLFFIGIQQQCWAPHVLKSSLKIHRIHVCASDDSFEQYILDTQRSIIKGAEHLDGSGQTFQHDRWERSPGNPNAGYGITSVLEGGNVLEKAAVNISVINGVLTSERAKAMSSRGRDCIDPAGGQSYSASAMSLVFHSAHPCIPTLRADVRLFTVEGRSWFGGGCDLTPFYLVDQDAVEFHAFWKNICDTYDHSVRNLFCCYQNLL